MRLSMEPNGQAEILSKAFANRFLIDVLEVVVVFDSDELALADTAVFVFEDGIIQVLVDVHEKGCAAIESLGDVVIAGDYEDRTGIRFRTISTPGIYIQRVFCVWEGSSTGAGYFVGMFLVDKEGALRYGVNLHLDDLVWSDTRTFWTYIGSILSSGSIRLGDVSQAESSHPM